MKRKDPENPVALPCGCVNRLGGEIDFCRRHLTDAQLEILRRVLVDYQSLFSQGSEELLAERMADVRALKPLFKSPAKTPAAAES